MSEQPQPHFNISVPEGVAGGHFADFVAVGQNGRYFTLDFATLVSQEPRFGIPTTVNAQVVSRVRLLPEQIFELMRALNQQLSAYEELTGKRSPEAGA